MQTSQCFCHQAAQPFVNNTCVTFHLSYETMTLLGNPKIVTPFNFKSIEMKQIKI
jgi:hypothetical protein